MEKQFIPYEQALELKELGFNEPCFGVYNYYKPSFPTLTDDKKVTLGYYDIYDLKEYNILAPLWQQGINFLLNKLNGYYCITFYKDETGYITDNRVDYLEYDFENFTECLKKLIEIVKRNTKSVGE